MLLLEFDVNDRQAQEYFDYAGYHTRRMTPMFRQIAELVHGYVEAQFDTEGYAMSGGWAELAPSTIADRGSAHPILVREGVLKHDATRHPRRGAEFGSGLHYGNGWLTFMPESWRNGVDLVEVHSEGRKPGEDSDGREYPGMPARPIWETPISFNAEVGLIALEWLNELKHTNVRRAGRDIPRPSDIEPTFSFEGELF